MDFNFTWRQDLSYLWSHMILPGNQNPSTINTVTVQLGQPQLLFEYITPKELQFIPRSCVYPYFIVDRYPTDANELLQPGQVKTLPSANIQLNSIPRRMYIFARRRNADQTYLTTDTYLSIENISINWNNYSGLLSNATKQDLYFMSVKNGLNMDWSQWSGGPIWNALAATTAYGTVGSVLCVEFGTDIGLSDVEAPGLLGTYQLQMQVNVKNVNQTVAINPTLYVLIVSEGTFTIQDNRSVSQIGVITKTDILDSKSSPFVDYKLIESVYGGDFLSGLKSFGSDLLSGIKKALPVIKDAVEIGAKVAPYVAPLLMGLGEDQGGVMVGGKRKYKKKCKYCLGAGCDDCAVGALQGGAKMSRAELKRRLMR